MCVGDRMRVVFLGENDNGSRVINFLAESCLCVDNTYFRVQELA